MSGRGPSTLTSADTGFVDDSIRYEIKVPTNVELAPNLKGKLLLVHGDMDNNVHPGNTIRLGRVALPEQQHPGRRGETS